MYAALEAPSLTMLGYAGPQMLASHDPEDELYQLATADVGTLRALELAGLIVASIFAATNWIPLNGPAWHRSAQPTDNGRYIDPTGLEPEQ